MRVVRIRILGVGPALLLVALTSLPALPSPAAGQAAADSAGVRQAALDYIEGWYQGDADRMARALHPELVKRIVESTPGGARLAGMTADQLVDATRRRGASGAGGVLGRRDVRVLDIFGNAALARVDADEWVDYLHLARWNGEWRIVNVLWELR